MTASVGIERLSVYPCTLSIDMAELVASRGGNVDEVCGEMMIAERSLNPSWEDPVTMAVNAAIDLIDTETRDRIKLLLVGSESGLDQEKALSTWVHRFLELRDDCRNMEIKHACYAGTSAVRLAAAMLLADPDPDAAALVITTDESRAHFHKPYEFVMGAGSVAMLISKRPDVFELDFALSGVYAHEVADLIRPTSRVEAGHSETSLLSYLDAADITFDRYRCAVEASEGVSIKTVDELASWFPMQVYHAPFGGITKRAHKAVLRLLNGYDRKAASDDFDERILPSLAFNARMGGTYASSVFVSLAAAAQALGPEANGKRCGIYSYGSGSCAEFYSGRFGAGATGAAEGLSAKLDGRKALTVQGYEEAELFRAAQIDEGDFSVSLDGSEGWYSQHYAGRGLLCLKGASEFVRRYEWS